MIWPPLKPKALCAKCGVALWSDPALNPGGLRLCAQHLHEALAAAPPFVDGSRVTPGTEKCMCDSDTPRPDGQQRDCEFPCWQRLGLTSEPCCPDCAPLEAPDEPRASVTAIAPHRPSTTDDRKGPS